MSKTERTITPAQEPLLGHDKDPFAGVTFPIGVAQACRIANVTESQLKHYDKKGFLVPQRTGEGVANNRKLYSRQDMERLMGLLILQSYGFGLAQAAALLDAGQTIDDEATGNQATDGPTAAGATDFGPSFDAVLERMADVRREQNRLRDLALFLKYVEASQLPLITGLACGPADIEAAADWVRGCPAYESAMANLDCILEEGLSDEDDEESLTRLDLLCTILWETAYAPADTLAQQEDHLNQLDAWWNANVAPLAQDGFLNFYAAVEDHEVSEVLLEAVDESCPGDLQMWFCFGFLMDLATNAAPFVQLAAAESQQDVVRALAAAELLVPLIEAAFVGHMELCHEASKEVVELGLRRMEHLLGDETLLALLGWSDKGLPTKGEVAATRQVMQLLFEQHEHNAADQASVKSRATCEPRC